MRLSTTGTLIGVIGLLLVATPVHAQVPCVRHDVAFACADGTSLAIYDDPWGMGGPRGRRGGMDRGSGEAGFGVGCGGPACGWWKDDRYVHGPNGEVCLQHGTHVHCSGTTSDP